MRGEYIKDYGTQCTHLSLWSSIHQYANDKVRIIRREYMRATWQVFKESGASICLDFKRSDEAFILTGPRLVGPVFHPLGCQGIESLVIASISSDEKGGKFCSDPHA